MLASHSQIGQHISESGWLNAKDKPKPCGDLYIFLIQYVDGLRTLGHNPVATANSIGALYLHSVYVPNMFGFLLVQVSIVGGKKRPFMLVQPQRWYWGNPWLQTAPKYQKAKRGNSFLLWMFIHPKISYNGFDPYRKWKSIVFPVCSHSIRIPEKSSHSCLTFQFLLDEYIIKLYPPVF